MALAVAGTRGTLASLDARSTRVQPWPYNHGVASTKALCALRKEANLIPCLMPQVATKGGGAYLSQPKPCRCRRVQIDNLLVFLQCDHIALLLRTTTPSCASHASPSARRRACRANTNVPGTVKNASTLHSLAACCGVTCPHSNNAVSGCNNPARILHHTLAPHRDALHCLPMQQYIVTSLALCHVGAVEPRICPIFVLASCAQHRARQRHDEPKLGRGRSHGGAGVGCAFLRTKRTMGRRGRASIGAVARAVGHDTNIEHLATSSMHAMPRGRNSQRQLDRAANRHMCRGASPGDRAPQLEWRRAQVSAQRRAKEVHRWCDGATCATLSTNRPTNNNACVSTRTQHDTQQQPRPTSCSLQGKWRARWHASTWLYGSVPMLSGASFGTASSMRAEPAAGTTTPLWVAPHP